MPVSGKGPAPREVPFALLTDTPDMEAVGKAVAEYLSQFMSFGQGLLAARPAAVASNEGHIYWATDDTTFGPNGTWWVSYGSTWHEAPLPTITTALLAASAVTEGKIAEEAVTTSKLKNLGVTAAKIAAEAIETSKISSGAVTSGKLAAGAVINSALGTEAVENSKIAKETITGEKLHKGSLGDAVTGSSISAWGAIKEGVTKAEAETGFTSSATRPVMVMVSVIGTESAIVDATVFVAGAKIGTVHSGAITSSSQRLSFTFIVPANVAWKVTGTFSSIAYSVLPL